LKDGVFKRNHVNFLAGIPKSAQKNLTEAVALALTLDNKTQREAVIGAIFDRIHKDRDRVSVYQRVGVREVFKEQGVDHKWFDENVESSVVQMHVNKMESIQDKMTSMDAIKGVPTVVVNGKYRVETSKLNRKDPVNDYIALVDFLMTNP
jgi:thiol:disulfide interchange protein DsbA